MGDSWGLETPLVVRAAKAKRRMTSLLPPLQRFRAIGAECRAVRESVGVTEIANFAKYEVTGPGAEGFLSI
jgi:dimethylglycine dehydrogenase